MNPNREELEMFRLGGANAERMAVLSYSKRVGLDPGTARRRLAELVAAPLPKAWREARS